MAETDVQSKQQNLLKWLGGWVIKVVTSNRGGTPDIVACVPMDKDQIDKLFETQDTIGVFVAIEAKDWEKKARPLQKAQIKKINKAGGIAFEADSIEKATRILSQHFKI